MIRPAEVVPRRAASLGLLSNPPAATREGFSYRPAGAGATLLPPIEPG